MKNKINYLLDDLSQIDTKVLKQALNGYRLLTAPRKTDIYYTIISRKSGEEHRIEGELLSRKELDLDPESFQP